MNTRISLLNKIFFLVVISLLLSGTGTAADRYIAPEGLDSNDGLTLATPWGNLSKCGGSTLSVGDTCWVINGTYNMTGNDHTQYVGSGAYDFQNNGTIGNPIRIKSYNGTPHFINLGGSVAWVQVENKSYYDIEGAFLIEGGGYTTTLADTDAGYAQGVVFTGQYSHHNTVRDITTYKTTGSGIIASTSGAHDILVENNTISYAGRGGGNSLLIMTYKNNLLAYNFTIKNNSISNFGSESHNGIDIHTNVSNATIEYNTFYNQTGAAAIYAHVSFNIPTSQENIIIKNNRIDQTHGHNTTQNYGQGDGIYMMTANNSMIENNTLINISSTLNGAIYYAYELDSGEGWCAGRSDINCTITPGIIEIGHPVYPKGLLTNITIQNNIISLGSLLYYGIKTNSLNTTRADVKDVFLYNNTITNCYSAGCYYVYALNMTVRDININSPENWSYKANSVLPNYMLEYSNGRLFQPITANLPITIHSGNKTARFSTSNGIRTIKYTTIFINPELADATARVIAYSPTTPQTFATFNLNTTNGNLVHINVTGLTPSGYFWFNNSADTPQNIQANSLGEISYNSSVWNGTVTITGAPNPPPTVSIWNNITGTSGNVSTFSRTIMFNSTANQPLTGYAWRINGVLQSGQTNNFLNYSFLDGDYIVRSEVTSANGSSQLEVYANISTVVDNVTITNIVPIVSYTSLNITYDVNQSNALSQICIGTTGSLGTCTSNLSTGTTRSSVAGGLKANTLYYYSVFAYNNTNTSYFINSTMNSLTTSSFNNSVINITGLLWYSYNYSNNNVTANENYSIKVGNLDEYAEDGNIVNWTRPTGSDVALNSNLTFVRNGSYSLMFNSSVTDNVYAYMNLGKNYTNNFSVSFSILVPDGALTVSNEEQDIYFNREIRTNSIYLMVFNNSGVLMLRYFNNGTATNILNLNRNQWYNIRMNIYPNFTLLQYGTEYIPDSAFDLYVDSISKLTKVGTLGNITAFTNFSTSGLGTESDDIVYVDNIRIFQNDTGIKTVAYNTTIGQEIYAFCVDASMFGSNATNYSVDFGNGTTGYYERTLSNISVNGTSCSEVTTPQQNATIQIIMNSSNMVSLEIYNLELFSQTQGEIITPPTYHLSGYVFYQNGTGINGVTISNGTNVSITNSTGYYILNMSNGTYLYNIYKGNTFWNYSNYSTILGNVTANFNLFENQTVNVSSRIKYGINYSNVSYPSWTTEIDIGNDTSAIFRGLIRFNISEYNTSWSNYTDAEIGITWEYTESNENTTIELYGGYSFSRPYVSWINKSSVNPWATQGGDWFDRTGTINGNQPFDSFTLPSGQGYDGEYHYFNITELWNGTMNGTYNNDGYLYLFLKATNESPVTGNNYVAFYGYDGLYPPILDVTTSLFQPNITSFTPSTPNSTLETDIAIFNITIDQSVTTTWYLNGTVVQTNTSVTGASYTNISAKSGTWNVSVFVNNSNGTDYQAWNWTVIPYNSTPLISGVSNGTVTDTSGIINFTVNQTVIFNIEYGKTGSLGTKTINQTINVGDNSTNITGLDNNTVYYYSVFAYNSTNTSLFSNSTVLNFTTNNNVSSSQVIGNYSVSGYIKDSLGSVVSSVSVVNGTNSTNTNSSGYYQITNMSNGSYNFTFSKSGFNTNYSNITIDGINATVNVTLLDTTSPLSITNLLASSSTTTSITWTWTNSSSTDINYTSIYIDNIFQANTSNNLYTKSGLSSSTSYTISTRTVDIYGNINLTWINSTNSTSSSSSSSGGGGGGGSPPTDTPIPTPIPIPQSTPSTSIQEITEQFIPSLSPYQVIKPFELGIYSIQFSPICSSPVVMKRMNDNISISSICNFDNIDINFLVPKTIEFLSFIDNKINRNDVFQLIDNKWIKPSQTIVAASTDNKYYIIQVHSGMGTFTFKNSFKDELSKYSIKDNIQYIDNYLYERLMYITIEIQKILEEIKINI